MPSAHDVASFILKECGPMTAMKLHKLLYYAQAWSLVWDEKPLFPEKIEAWANGPVVRALYQRHKGQFEVREWEGDTATLDENQIDSIKKVLAFYGGKSSQWLSDLTHKEKPWRQARKGLRDEERGNNEITLPSMAEFYGALLAEKRATQSGVE